MVHPTLPALAAAFLALAAPPAAAAAAVSAPDPTGTWTFDRQALEAVGDRLASAMAAELPAERRRAVLERAKELEARYARLAKSDPQGAERLEPELREARTDARSLLDPKAYFKREIMASLGDAAGTTIEIRPGGDLVYTGAPAPGAPPRRASGAWKLEGDTIVLATALPLGGGELIALGGPVADRRLELKYAPTSGDARELADDPKLAQALREVTWVLVRKP
jgi:hypothetical protein